MSPAHTASFVLDPLLPWPVLILAAVVLAALTAAVYYQLAGSLEAGRNSALLIFRVSGSLFVLLLLLQPSRLEKIPPPTIEKVTLVGMDTSSSMKQRDHQNLPRLDAAKSLLVEAGLVARDGKMADGDLRLFEFSEDAAPVTDWTIPSAKGRSTRIHRSVTTMINSLGAGQGAKALLLLTDGHDFELVNPSKTGFLARSRDMPIYAVAFGAKGKVRDLAVRITGYPPYCYVKQRARISASVRAIGCEYETIQVQLLRQNKVVQTQRLNTDENGQIPVQFEIAEDSVGQFEYEVRVLPIEGESDKSNNSAVTFLNVVDQKIRVLLLEGSPYWDTTFLQRSLMRSDKVELDQFVKYAPNKVRRIRKHGNAEELKIPETVADFLNYDVVILGRAVDDLLDRKRLDALQEFVREKGGAVIFSRGRAFNRELARNDLEPVVWSDTPQTKVRIQPGAESRTVAPLRLLSDPALGGDNLPELLAGRTVVERKPLAATLATAQGNDQKEAFPAMIHRRHGTGQVLSLGVDGLWRWGFNAKVEGPNSIFDRFWDQMILWMLAMQDFTPNQDYSLRVASANVQLGEKAYFRLAVRNPQVQVRSVPMTIFLNNQMVLRTALVPPDGRDAQHLTAEFLPEKVGQFRAVAALPNNKTIETRFIVFSENFEDIEVATDQSYLRKLCESSGGRVLQPSELGKLAAELRQMKVDLTPKTRLTPLWDRAWIFYFIGLLFGVDWYLRRRWGLC